MEEFVLTDDSFGSYDDGEENNKFKIKVTPH